jgi:hypothetical protein
MDIESADTNTPGWFIHRTTASKNIIENMTDLELKKLKEQRDRMANEGLPINQQRRYE